MLFASVQTLGRRRTSAVRPRHFRLHRRRRVPPRRRAHLSAPDRPLHPTFLLGPDRDARTHRRRRPAGALCQENLVYRCDLAGGSTRDCSRRSDYFGVPDEVDYANIPWRSRRFDEAGADHGRRHAAARGERPRTDCGRRGGRRAPRRSAARSATPTSWRDYFNDAGVRAGGGAFGPRATAPRAPSLERLRRASWTCVFAVDMFNEGVDLPTSIPC